MSAFKAPLEYSLMQGIWRPSTNTEVDFMDMLPGTMPPTSVKCPNLRGSAEQPTFIEYGKEYNHVV